MDDGTFIGCVAPVMCRPGVYGFTFFFVRPAADVDGRCLALAGLEVESAPISEARFFIPVSPRPCR